MTRDEEKELVARLENWGRRSAEHIKPGVSPMFRHVITELEEEEVQEAPKSLSTLRPYDREDAERIDAAWHSLPIGPERTLIQVVYALGCGHIPKACAKLGLRRKTFFKIRRRAHNLLWYALH